jgi:hypothetical protein
MELRLSRKERIRLEVLSRVKRKEITITRAAELAGLSLRQMRRLWKRFAARGDVGLVHRSRGQRPNNRLDDATRAELVALYQARYHDFGPTLACEKLKADDHELSPDTLTRLLKEAGLWQPRRKRARHRTRRQRRACFGQLLQMDGSEHDWFEGRSERCVLMVAIDDATSHTLARFHRRETLDAAFDLFGRWTMRHGLPRALYVDRAAIYRADRQPDGDELLAGKTPVTQFGRAMQQLEVELILANSPQAKGRVERRNAVFQDRLVKELRLAGIDDMERANALLDDSFLASSTPSSVSKPRTPPTLIGRSTARSGSTRFSASRRRASSATTGASAGTTAGCRSLSSTRRWHCPARRCGSSTNATARCCWSTTACVCSPRR